MQVTARDTAGNTKVEQVSFAVDLYPLVLTLVAPRFGVATSQICAVNISSDDPAECRRSSLPGTPYESMLPFPQTGGKFHAISVFTIPTPQGSPTTIYVRCNDTYGIISSERTFEISWDNTPPVIQSLSIDPGYNDGTTIFKLIEPPFQTDLLVATDDDTICRYSRATGVYDQMEGKFSDFDTPVFRTSHKIMVAGFAEGPVTISG